MKNIAFDYITYDNSMAANLIRNGFYVVDGPSNT